ncbi:MAG TPA: ABC transporter ATP-binding protein [Bdellovibrionota bacterium]|nr:ABC transporter ATP-binding protein [Bdellovibrionota bacterium]
MKGVRPSDTLNEHVQSTLLDVRSLSIGFRAGKKFHRAVDQISFHLERGETFSLVGESGCGKTVTALSLLRLITYPPGKIESGEIRYDGRDLLQIPLGQMRRIRGKEIAMIFQEPMTSLNPVFTVGDQIAEAIEVHQRVGSHEAKARACEAMHRVGFPAPKERYDDYPHQMSGGMRQRIMIAMALSCNPKVLVADEPTTALDVTIQAQILALIDQLQEETQMGVLLITHDLGVVAEVADRVAVMYAGVIVELANVKNLFAHPRHPYTQALYRSIPRPGAHSSKEKLEVIPGRVPPLGAVPPYCRFYDRCPLAAAECKEREPDLREVSPGHFVRCIKA